MNDASERRAAPRFEIFAQASVVYGDEVHLLSVRNISAAGAFLEGRPEEHADLAPGGEIEVALSATAPGMGDEEVINIDCLGRVARVELLTAVSPGGFAISLEPKTAQDRERLEELLSRLSDLPAAPAPASRARGAPRPERRPRRPARRPAWRPVCRCGRSRVPAPPSPPPPPARPAPEP